MPFYKNALQRIMSMLTACTLLIAVSGNECLGEEFHNAISLQGFTGQLTESIFGGQASIDDAWSFWSTDPPHLANLLNSVDTIIGIGVVQVGLATYYTQDFAMPPAP